MEYSIYILPKAIEEIQDAFEYYLNISDKVLNNFDKELEDVFKNLEKNPFYEVKHKNLRAIPFKSFPFLVFFDIDPIKNIVFIYSVFHTSQNPEKLQ